MSVMKFINEKIEFFSSHFALVTYPQFPDEQFWLRFDALYSHLFRVFRCSIKLLFTENGTSGIDQYRSCLLLITFQFHFILYFRLASVFQRHLFEDDAMLGFVAFRFFTLDSNDEILICSQFGLLFCQQASKIPVKFVALFGETK